MITMYYNSQVFLYLYLYIICLCQGRLIQVCVSPGRLIQVCVSPGRLTQVCEITHLSSAGCRVELHQPRAGGLFVDQTRRGAGRGLGGLAAGGPLGAALPLEGGAPQVAFQVCSGPQSS